MQLCAWGSRMPSWPVSNISILVAWWLVGDFQVQNCRALAGDPRSKLSFYFVVEIMQVGWLLKISLEDEWVGCQGAVRQMELFKIFAFEAWIAWSWLFFDLKLDTFVSCRQAPVPAAISDLPLQDSENDKDCRTASGNGQSIQPR